MGARKTKRPSLARRVKFVRAKAAGKRHLVPMKELVAAALRTWRAGHQSRRFKLRKLDSRRSAATIRFAVADGFHALDDFVEHSGDMGLSCTIKLPKR